MKVFNCSNATGANNYTGSRPPTLPIPHYSHRHPSRMRLTVLDDLASPPPATLNPISARTKGCLMKGDRLISKDGPETKYVSRYIWKLMDCLSKTVAANASLPEGLLLGWNCLWNHHRHRRHSYLYIQIRPRLRAQRTPVAPVLPSAPDPWCKANSSLPRVLTSHLHRHPVLICVDNIVALPVGCAKSINSKRH